MTCNTRHALILYGPPGSGKSTITECLKSTDRRFALYPRLKTSTGPHPEYRMTTAAVIKSLDISGHVVWQNERYGYLYAIDYPYLEIMFADGLIPVLHTGQVAAVKAIVDALPDAQITQVSLTVPKNVAEQRIRARATDDVTERLAAFDETPPLPGADVVIDTHITSSGDATGLIIGFVRGHQP